MITACQKEDPPKPKISSPVDSFGSVKFNQQYYQWICESNNGSAPILTNERLHIKLFYSHDSLVNDLFFAEKKMVVDTFVFKDIPVGKYWYKTVSSVAFNSGECFPDYQPQTFTKEFTVDTGQIVIDIP